MPSSELAAARSGALNWSLSVNSAEMARVADMLDSILSYANDHAWAGWALTLFLFAPPILMAAAKKASGLQSLDMIIGWLALLLILAVLMA
ncbi:hypothetical protein Tchar_02651 [Tepidimonas charontis]|uniref:Uncharacterized protein n=2 Tax=Tepidimonas charontis TaxID=2267262 RepID=A0A554WZ73_9BURK|nr:hypothetical protein Tchar_02651 [Tepidimonas charontis]